MTGVATEADALKSIPNKEGFEHIFLDLRHFYDESLLNKFYSDLMVPNFPIADELDPLDKWVALLNPFSKDVKAGVQPDFHIMLLLSHPIGATNYTNSTIMGGVVFEYYVASNTALLTYLLTSTKFRGFGIGKVLAEKCRDVLEMNAKSRGHLAGCNAIFLETNSAVKVQESADVMNPAKRHEIFYKMGLRLVDFDYVQAPLFKGKKKVNYLLLCVFLTERIPKREEKFREDSGSYYLPSSLLRNTIYAFWNNSSMLTGYKFLDDVDYKRMMDQLVRREKISLLDLPWDRPFTIVDLQEHFDLELLVQFYQDMLFPCFATRKDELDSLDHWIAMLAPSTTIRLSKAAEHEDTEECLHLLLALKYLEDEDEHSKPVISGALAFEYYPSNNCGLLTYLVTPPAGARMAGTLIDQALERLDAEARHRGHLGGCNVIFLEAASEPIPVNPNLEVTDMTLQHQTMEKMGWKVLDFDYIQPPFIDSTKKKAMKLMVYVTTRIPKLSQEESEYLFLPRTTVKAFVEELWYVNCRRIKYEASSDMHFRRMMSQLERREKIPLCSRSELLQKPWTLVDLCEDWDPELVKRFWVELVQPNQSSADTSIADTLDGWTSQLSQDKKSVYEDRHALLALRSAQTGDTAEILGGLTFNYFVQTNCGLITSALLKKTDVRESVAKGLVERAISILDQNAVSRGNLVGANAIFLEIRESDSDATDGEDLSRQHTLLEKMGWRLIDFNYVAPPLARGGQPRPRLSLSIFLTPRIPRVPYEQQGYEFHYMPKPLMKQFMQHLWRVRCTRINYDYEQREDYRKMMDLIERRERIPLLELPWQRNWTLVDLWEDYDVELLYKFYQTFYAAVRSEKASREPLSYWLRSMSPLVKANPEEVDTHLLLALNYSKQTSNNKPDILGGLRFAYYGTVNTGLINFIAVNQSYGVVMARAMLEECAEILVENAIQRGFIAGCNAIFLEVPCSEEPSASADLLTELPHDVLHSMGWRMLDLEYVKPPPSTVNPQGVPSLLLCLQTNNIPKDAGGLYVPRETVMSFVKTVWTEAYKNHGKSLSRDPGTYNSLIGHLKRVEKVPLLDLPWKYRPLVMESDGKPQPPAAKL